MQLNPMNVIQLLLTVFQAMNIPTTPTTNNERDLAEGIASTLIDAMENYLPIEYIPEISLDFQEQYKDWEYIPVDDNSWIPPDGGKRKCTRDDDEDVTFGYKKNAVQYWTGCGRRKLRSLQVVQNRYRRVTSREQLYQWQEQLELNGTYVEKIKNICEFTLKQCKNALQSGSIFHDIDIRRWGLQAKSELGYDGLLEFIASAKWVKNFKKAHRIVSRKVNKFISRRTFEEADELKENADKFVNDVKNVIPSYGFHNVYNTDQSGFQLEMHSGRTLAEAGIRKVQCVVKSLSATTHSYTVQPIISADGRLLPVLFLVLKEQSGGFGPIVQKNLFKATNVYVTASTSGKLTSGK